ncbi:aminodeoxychorismate synthase component I [Pseudomonas salmasensis]|uniref:aminodeoxychorismate synthase n=1 Tax=Pseudomonas salmasensis TaxID=2745514 RepID=A0ABU5FCZ4_9PSED|nr:aminodeoxychorismate synthase component I [Pseudomonas salmasensis]MDY4299744.1 aminodeoxychorismate synthase component I [Pseudomonas salmasensis]
MTTFDVEVRALDYNPDPLRVFRSEFLSSPRHFFLESSVVKPGFSRFSFMGDSHGRLAETITYEASSHSVCVECSDGITRESTQDFLQLLASRLNHYQCKQPDRLPFDFNLGYVGLLGYELKSQTIGAQAYASRSHDAAFILATRMIAFDHAEQRCYLLYLVEHDQDRQSASHWFDQVQARLHEQPRGAQPISRQRKLSLPQVEAWIQDHASIRHSKQCYIDKINEAQREIIDGETYEVCLTNLIEFPFADSPFDLYTVMRELTPAPHAGYFSIPDFQIVSSSPERFLKIDRHHQVEAKPIKGTRPRGRCAEEDQELIEQMRGDEKDRAENLMIVDLLRNDLGQVCTIGSVRVPALFAVETYSHVHQLVSTISGQLKPSLSAVDCVRATFPGGSMTGAPKKRTMEIIDRLEEGPRGAYSGSLGWFGLGGACDLNIMIRSITVDAQVARFGVGGAITSLSDPLGEYIETIVKASGVVEAVTQLRNTSV